MWRPYPVESPLQSGRASIIKGALNFGRSIRHPATIKEGASLVAYSSDLLFINGKWRPSQSGRTIAVLNPATEETIGTVAHADRADLDEALEAANKGFKAWRAVAPFERCRIMRKAAQIMRERNDEIGRSEE